MFYDLLSATYHQRLSTFCLLHSGHYSGRMTRLSRKSPYNTSLPLRFVLCHLRNSSPLPRLSDPSGYTNLKCPVSGPFLSRYVSLSRRLTGKFISGLKIGPVCILLIRTPTPFYGGSLVTVYECIPTLITDKGGRSTLTED